MVWSSASPINFFDDFVAVYSQVQRDRLWHAKRKIVPSTAIRNLCCNWLTGLSIQNGNAGFLVSKLLFSCRIFPECGFCSPFGTQGSNPCLTGRSLNPASKPIRQFRPGLKTRWSKPGTCRHYEPQLATDSESRTQTSSASRGKRVTPKSKRRTSSLPGLFISGIEPRR
jgi:hypothetical protein